MEAAKSRTHAAATFSVDVSTSLDGGLRLVLFACDVQGYGSGAGSQILRRRRSSAEGFSRCDSPDLADHIVCLWGRARSSLDDRRSELARYTNEPEKRSELFC